MKNQIQNLKEKGKEPRKLSVIAAWHKEQAVGQLAGHIIKG